MKIILSEKYKEKTKKIEEKNKQEDKKEEDNDKCLHSLDIHCDGVDDGW